MKKIQLQAAGVPIAVPFSWSQ